MSQSKSVVRESTLESFIITEDIENPAQLRFLKGEPVLQTGYMFALKPLLKNEDKFSTDLAVKYIDEIGLSYYKKNCGEKISSCSSSILSRHTFTAYFIGESEEVSKRLREIDLTGLDYGIPFEFRSRKLIFSKGVDRSGKDFKNRSSTIQYLLVEEVL